MNRFQEPYIVDGKQIGTIHHCSNEASEVIFEILKTYEDKRHGLLDDYIQHNLGSYWALEFRSEAAYIYETQGKEAARFYIEKQLALSFS